MPLRQREEVQELLREELVILSDVGKKHTVRKSTVCFRSDIYALLLWLFVDKILPERIKKQLFI